MHYHYPVHFIIKTFKKIMTYHFAIHGGSLSSSSNDASHDYKKVTAMFEITLYEKIYPSKK